MGDTGLEPVTPSVSSGGISIPTPFAIGSYENESGSLHSSLPQNVVQHNGDPLAALIGSLTPEQRARLAALLAGQGSRGMGQT